jgi:hypothetical protein
MKANELRIGNLLFDRGDKILRLDYWDFMKPAQRMFLGDSELHPLTENLEYCKPIPLTEEWMFKFGFIKSSDNNYYKGGKFTIYNRFGNFGLIGGSLSWKEFKHVHQLQNLYFALTGEELTYGGNK